MTVEVRLSFLALVAIGALMGAMLGSMLFRTLRSDRSDLQPYTSNFLAGGKNAVESGALSVNYISQPTIFDDGVRFSYWTGGLSTGKQPLTPPTLVTAVARQGLVGVELKANADAPNQAALADAVARQIDVVTRLFWPDEEIPVAVELHQVPENSRYEFARKITWRDGQPFHLTLFIGETAAAEAQAGIAVHELYHVLATRWRLGTKSQRGIASPWLGSLYEEMAATLLADCGSLHVTGRLVLPEGNMTLTLRGKDGGGPTYKGSLDAKGLAHVLDPESGFKFPAGFMTDLLHRTALLALVPEGEAIVAGSGSAQQLMALCHDATRDPWFLDGWFRGLADPPPSR